MNMETREARIGGDLTVELRANGDSESPTITGYAVVFDSLSENLGGFRERVKRGAFSQSLEDNDEVHALFNHDDDRILGRRGSGTLRLWEDDHGLRIEIDPPNTTDGNDVVELLRRGDLVSMSFGFFDVSDSWAMEGGEDIRTIQSARLFDVSVVTNPAYKATSVGIRCEQALRSLEDFKGSQNVIDNTNFDSVGEVVDLRLKLRIVEQE